MSILAAGFSVGSLAGYAGVLGFVVAVAALAGTAWRVGKNTQTVNNYRESAQSWEARAKSYEEDLADVTAKNEDFQRQISEMQGKIHILEEVASGRAAMEALTTQITETVKELRLTLVTKDDFTAWQRESRQALAALAAKERP